MSASRRIADVWSVATIDTSLGPIRTAWVDGLDWIRFGYAAGRHAHLTSDGHVHLPGADWPLADLYQACEVASALLAACVPGGRA